MLDSGGPQLLARREVLAFTRRPGAGIQELRMVRGFLMIDGGVAEWEARVGVDLAVLIRRYLSENPCPGASSTADRVEAWASALDECSRGRLADLGTRRLRRA